MRVLIADDSLIFRRIIAEALRPLAEVEVAGFASTGVVAVRKVSELKPDLLTLDIEMPGMNGLEVLDAMRAKNLTTNVILISTLTVRGGAMTLQGLSKGAFDFVTKPEEASFEENLNMIRADSAPRVKALARRLELRDLLGGVPDEGRKQNSSSFDASLSSVDTRVQMSSCTTVASPPKKPEMVLIGVSTGGPSALERVLSQLPADLGVPVLVVQHMPPLFTRMLADNLSRNSRLTVVEATSGELLTPNCVYIAPGGRHMRVVPGSAREKRIEITDDAPENNCRPSVDYLFRSVANSFPGEAVAVILTGMGNDGTSGLRLLKRGGCKVLAQDEVTSVVFGMPKMAIEAGVVDCVIPIGEVAPRICSALRG